MSIRVIVPDLARELSKMEGVLAGLGDKGAKRAAAIALNAALAAGRKEAAKVSRKAYTAPIQKLFDNISLRKAKPASLSGELELGGRRGVSLIHFKAQPGTPLPPKARPAAGVSVQIKRGGTRYVKRSEKGGSKPFVMRKKQGGFGIFVRHSNRDYEMLYGPSPIQALQKEKAQAEVTEKISETFIPVLQASIDKQLARLGK